MKHCVKTKDFIKMGAYSTHLPGMKKLWAPDASRYSKTVSRE